MNYLAELKQINDLSGVPELQLQWLVNHAEVLSVKEGEYVFKSGDPVNRLLIILEGSIVFKTQQGNQFRVIGTFEKGTITGYLPYSRAKLATGYAQVLKPGLILSLSKDRFHDMIMQNEELTAALVHVMSSRIRNFTKAQQQNDKMMALGKLSAGLAHELNNPSAAVIRSAHSLSKHLRKMPYGFKSIIRIDMSDEEVDEVNRILFDRIEKPKAKLSMMQRANREDDLLDWLEDRKIEKCEDLVESLVAFDFSVDALEQIEQNVKGKDLNAVFHWFHQVLTTELLVSEIEEASGRINALVSSVKSYTHMDQAPEKRATNIHEGIDNTLNMLGHKLRKGNIKLVKEYDIDLPDASILVSEMNQVWTNLIDNAIDAMEDKEDAVLTIRTVRDQEYINVYISDSGSGIPEAIQDQIFDPLFTTKAIGKGTGLGLEVVHQIVTVQHNGRITFKSEPGHTEFKVCFPIT